MSNFKKLFIILVFILILEIILIYARYKVSSQRDVLTSKNKYIVLIDSQAPLYNQIKLSIENL